MLQYIYLYKSINNKKKLLDFQDEISQFSAKLDNDTKEYQRKIKELLLKLDGISDNIKILNIITRINREIT